MSERHGSVVQRVNAWVAENPAKTAVILIWTMFVAGLALGFTYGYIAGTNPGGIPL